MRWLYTLRVHSDFEEILLINPASLIGAILGFVVGLFLFGSPLLGMIFALLGSSIGSGIGVRVFRDSGNERKSSGWFSGWGAEGVSDGPLFMETLFSMLGRLAAADGTITAAEEAAFRSIVTGQLRITDPASVSTAMKIFHEAASGNVPMGDYARKAAQAFSRRPQLLEMMLIIMIRVSSADGEIHSEEDRLMREAASIFGFPHGTYESIKMRYGAYSGGGSSGSSGTATQTSGGLAAAYETLGVDKNAAEADIRKAYRKKASEYHPDKIAAKGLPKEFTDFANKKFQEIQKAWETVREARGF